jgi:hypothetical protein
MRRVNCQECGVLVEEVPWGMGKNQLDRLPLPGDPPAQTGVEHDNIRGADYFDSPPEA